MAEIYGPTLFFLYSHTYHPVLSAYSVSAHHHERREGNVGGGGAEIRVREAVSAGVPSRGGGRTKKGVPVGEAGWGRRAAEEDDEGCRLLARHSEGGGGMTRSSPCPPTPV